MGYSVSRHSRTDFHDITAGTESENKTANNAHESGCDNTCGMEVNTELLYEQIKNAKMWPGIFETVWGSEFSDAAHELFTLATTAMTELSKAGEFSQAEEIASSIMELTSAWGSQVLDCIKKRSYIREIIPVDVQGTKYSLYAGQYFKAEPFYEEDKRLVKLLYFHVKENSTKCRIMTYYLECSNIVQPFYVLGLAVSGTHAQVARYDRTRPSYWVVRQDVLVDIKTRMNALLSEQAPNNNNMASKNDATSKYDNKET